MSNADTGYNGWSNYETWLLNLHLSNNQGEHELWESEAERIFRHVIEAPTDYPDCWRRNGTAATNTLADAMKEAITDAIEEEASRSLYSLDCLGVALISSALQEVNWEEIAGHYVDSAEEVVDGYRRDEIREQIEDLLCDVEELIEDQS